jgi:glycosyltransferase involved in cell wall biosynthesis
LAEDGWECHVALPGPPRLADEYAACGAVVHVVPMARLTTSGGVAHWVRYGAGWPLAVGRLSALAWRVGATVVHTNSLHSWYGWAAAGLTGRPHVWHAREIVFQSSAALRVERILVRRFADRVIAVSAAVAAQLDPVNLVVITDEADPATFGPDRAGRFRSRLGLADDAPVVGSVARIDTWKGFGVLLDAVPALTAARPGLQLLVAGAPVPGKEDYEAGLRARAGVLPGVHWLGPRSDVGDLMADLDVFVQASTEPEPFGLVLVEALACGVPVVAAAAGGPLEILGRDPATGSADPAAPGDQTGPAGVTQGDPPADHPPSRLVPPGDAAALAAAVLALLPASTTTAARRARPARGSAGQARFAEVFDQVAAAGRPGRRRGIPGLRGRRGLQGRRGLRWLRGRLGGRG